MNCLKRSRFARTGRVINLVKLAKKWPMRRIKHISLTPKVHLSLPITTGATLCLGNIRCSRLTVSTFVPSILKITMEGEQN
ncbi:uncharacterized protein G2W53_029113 [Senna tora]|uniref:Uncharacterized protein n=1 Tax=Senna tora TaxID=362788 RepID=A0A834TDF2_9FABA|nr:uncharacterized protein G2W53_029113 [Senna tora]